MKTQYCLQSATSFTDVNKNPLNTSISKNLWTFAKTDRFDKVKVYCDSIYNIHGLKPSKYGVSIGKGNKADWTRDLTSSPSASKYFRRSFFDENISKKKGFSIGEGREQVRERSYIPLDPLKVPGPGAYKQIAERGTSYSFRKRTKPTQRIHSLESQNDNPGPGAYENPEALNASGHYMIAKHAGSGATKFNPRHSQRFFSFKNISPGPGTYRLPAAINETTHFVDARFQGTGQRAFSLGQKVSQFDDISKMRMTNPGPGSYRMPSDFGNYDGKVDYRRGTSLSKLK